jgi:hypothetical protein
MEATNEALFQLMRFNILNTSRPSLKDSPFSPAYIYAWENGVFPAFNDGADWHKPFAEQFDVTEDKINKISEFLDEKWQAKTPVSFYDLENHFDAKGSSNLDRVKLKRACRYMWLNEMFDDLFWSTLVENGKCPSEALSICRPLKDGDVYLM